MTRGWIACFVVAATLASAGCAGPGETVNEAAQSREPVLILTPAVAPIDSTLLASLLETQDEYRLGAGDVVEISALDLLEVGKVHTVETVVGNDGTLALPLAGTFVVNDRTVADLHSAVTTRLARLIREPSVSVRVREYRSQRIAVLGNVNDPGVKTLERTRVTVSHALGLAGGLKEPDAVQRAKLLRSRTGETVDVDLDALARGDLHQNLLLGPGDILQVLEPERFYVSGYVKTSGAYPLRRGMTALRAVALAGGVLVPDASPSLARIHRPGPTGITVIPVDLVAIADAEADDVPILAGDNLEVTQSNTRFVLVGVYNVIRGVFSVGYNLASLF